ncbi:10757_t:CDS:2, partial [Racocetra persica]
SEFSDSKAVKKLRDQQQDKEARSHKKKEVENIVQDDISDDQTNASEAVSDKVSESTSYSCPVNVDGGDPNSIIDDSDSDYSEEEMPDESDDDGYSGCGGYNEYGESDR